MLAYFKNKIIIKKQKKEALELMKDFAEGRMSTEDFWGIFKDNIFIKEILVEDKTRPSYSDKLYYSPERILDIYDANKLQDRAELHALVKKYFIRNKINCNFNNDDADVWDFLQELQPKWLYITDEEFILNIVKSVPSHLTKEKKKQLCQSKIKEIFKYEKEPPQWLQNPEWPIINGKPLVFKEMIEKIEHDLIINDYIFYDEITKEVIIVSQSDYR